MAEENAARRRELNRRLSVRQTVAGLRRALAELTPSQRTALRKTGFVPRPILATKAPSYAPTASAWATSPVTFRVSPEGKLATTRPLGIARHEVAHLVGQAQRGEFTGHGAIRAARAESSALGLRQASMLEPGRVPAMLARRRGVATSRGEFPRGFFETPHLRKVAREGSPESRRTARVQMMKLGRRLKARGVDF